MKTLFLNLASANVMLLAIVVVWGHFLVTGDEVARSRFEILVILVAVCSALMHSIVYTYFIAAGKFVESAVEEHGYPHPERVDQAKANKRKAFRYAFLAILAVMAAAFLHFAGSPVRGDGAIWRGWSAIAAYLLVIVQFQALRNEWKYIVANGVITRDVLATVADLRSRPLEEGGDSAVNQAVSSMK